MPGCPRKEVDIRRLVVSLAYQNPRWGSTRHRGLSDPDFASGDSRSHARRLGYGLCYSRVMNAYLNLVLLSQCLVACGGAMNGDGNAAQGGTMGGTVGTTQVSSGGATVGTTFVVGGSTASGGATSSTTCNSSPATFQVVPAPGSSVSWCLGQPGSCAGATLTIGNVTGVRDTASPLAITGGYCNTSCDSCTPILCIALPVACFHPEPVTDSGISMIWEGAYYLSSTCGASALGCTQQRCAPPGLYTAQVCGFVNPDPTNIGSCGMAASTTPQRCVTVSFNYPALDPVVIEMPSN